MENFWAEVEVVGISQRGMPKFEGKVWIPLTWREGFNFFSAKAHYTQALTYSVFLYFKNFASFSDTRVFNSNPKL